MDGRREYLEDTQERRHSPAEHQSNPSPFQVKNEQTNSANKNNNTRRDVALNQESFSLDW